MTGVQTCALPILEWTFRLTFPERPHYTHMKWRIVKGTIYWKEFSISRRWRRWALREAESIGHDAQLGPVRKLFIWTSNIKDFRFIIRWFWSWSKNFPLITCFYFSIRSVSRTIPSHLRRKSRTWRTSWGDMDCRYFVFLLLDERIKRVRVRTGSRLVYVFRCHDRIGWIIFWDKR